MADILQKVTRANETIFGFRRFAACVDEKRTAAMIDRDIAFAEENGITGTPTLFVTDSNFQEQAIRSRF